MKPEPDFYRFLIMAFGFAFAVPLLKQTKLRAGCYFWATWMLLGACIVLLLQILEAMG